MSGVFARLSPAARHDCAPLFTGESIKAKPLECAPSMEGKTCVITGATSGIGRAAAEALAAMGARVVMVARNKQRGEAMLTKLRDRFPLAEHSIHYADLLRLAEVKRAAADIAAAEPRVDVLLNNAGAMFAWRKITPDGFERTFALNHVAPFVLTHGLRERLFAAAPARVVNTAGALHHLATLHLEDLRLEHRYNAFYAYAHAKLCCVLFTRELAPPLDLQASHRQLRASRRSGDALRRPSRRTGPLCVLDHPPVREFAQARCESNRAIGVGARICWSYWPLFLQGEAGASQPASRG